MNAINRKIAELTELREQLVQLVEDSADEQHHPSCPILEALEA